MLPTYFNPLPKNFHVACRSILNLSFSQFLFKIQFQYSIIYTPRMYIHHLWVGSSGDEFCGLGVQVLTNLPLYLNACITCNRVYDFSSNSKHSISTFCLSDQKQTTLKLHYDQSSAQFQRDTLTCFCCSACIIHHSISFIDCCATITGHLKCQVYYHP